MTAWQVALGVYLILVAVAHLGVMIPGILMAIAALLAGMLVIVGK